MTNDLVERSNTSVVPIRPKRDAAATDNLAPNQLAAAEYSRRGWQLVAVQPGAKKIAGSELERARVDPHDIRSTLKPAHNLGIRLSPESDGLVDVDLDWQTARDLAPFILGDLGHAPSFGRKGKSAGHMLFQCPDITKTFSFAISKELASQLGVSALPDNHACCVLQVLANRHVVAPPSMHANGDEVVWYNDGEPLPISDKMLRAHVGALAFLAVVLQFYPAPNQAGQRDDICMALSGALVRVGFDVGTVDAWVQALANLAGDEEWRTRGKGKQSDKALDAGGPVTGIPRVVSLLGLPDGFADLFRQWLAVSECKPPSGARILDPRDHVANAAIFLNDRFSMSDGNTLIRHRGEFRQWSCGAYLALSDEAIDAAGRQFLHASYAKSAKSGQPLSFRPTSHDVKELIAATRSAVLIDDRRDLPFWKNAQATDPTDIVACQNGLLDLRTGELLPPTPQFVTDTVLGVSFDPHAPRPERWLRYLEEIWLDDRQSQQCLQEVFGYFLTADTSQHRIPVWNSPKRGGKGTAAWVLEQLVGASSLCSPRLTELSGDFGLQSFMGKKIALIADMRLGKRADPAEIVQQLLRISAGDPITINRKHLSHWTGRLSVKFFIHTNGLPNLNDPSGALRGRYLIIKSTTTFAGREDVDLKQKLKPELPGIMLWALEGLRRLKERGHFIEPDAAVEDRRQMIGLTSTVHAFVEEQCILCAEAETSKVVLFQGWQAWCAKFGHRSGSSSTFFRDLHAAFPGKFTDARPTLGGHRERVIVGIKPSSPW